MGGFVLNVVRSVLQKCYAGEILIIMTCWHWSTPANKPLSFYQEASEDVVVSHSTGPRKKVGFLLERPPPEEVLHEGGR